MGILILEPHHYEKRDENENGEFFSCSWAECQAQTNGFQNPRFKKFETEAEAKEFVQGADTTATPKKGGTSAQASSNDTLKRKHPGGNGKRPEDFITNLLLVS